MGTKRPLDDVEWARAELDALRRAETRHTVRSIRIAIVEDDEHLATSMVEIANALGHTTRVAADGASALRLIADFHPNLVFVDLSLPRLAGLEVVRLARVRLGRAARIVATSTFADNMHRTTALAAGCDALLAKPFTGALVAAEIQQAIATSTRRQ